MIRRIFGRKSQRNHRSNRPRKRSSRVRVESLESRRLFAADFLSINVEPPPPTDGPSDIAAEVSTVGETVPQDSFSINFAKIETTPQAGQTGSDLLIVNNGDGSD